MPRLQRERHDRDEAEGEPLPALEDFRGVVSAIGAARCHVLVAFKLGGEGVGAAGEDERHGWGVSR